MALYEKVDLLNMDVYNIEKGYTHERTYTMHFFWRDDYVETITTKLLDRDYEWNRLLFSIISSNGESEWAIWDGRHCRWISDTFCRKKIIVHEWMKIKSMETREEVRNQIEADKIKEAKRVARQHEMEKNRKHPAKTPDWVHEAWDRYNFGIMHGLR